MLRLMRLGVQGFGPFADRQQVEFPRADGVTVIYGENMRGKTSLLNAIRYAFFGTVLGRGSRPRSLHTITNRDLAAHGEYGFSVSLEFEYDGQTYELVRECKPKVEIPQSDSDYRETVLLRANQIVFGPQERDRTLQKILPKEISRFFLFDGELLQEYEELLIHESESGRRISEAIERILGVPILKRARLHLRQLVDEADRFAAREAARDQRTQALGVALEQATKMRDEHRLELRRLEERLDKLLEDKVYWEQALEQVGKYSSILEERDAAEVRLRDIVAEQEIVRSELKSAMGEAWRSLLKDTIRSVRELVRGQAKEEVDLVALRLKAEAAIAGRCGTCGQHVPPDVAQKLKTELPDTGPVRLGGRDEAVPAALMRLADLDKFREADNVGEIRQLAMRLKKAQLETVALEDEIRDLNEQLADADPEMIRQSKASYGEVIDSIAIHRRGIAAEREKIEEQEQSIRRLSREIEQVGSANLVVGQKRVKLLRDTAAIFEAAVEQYKSKLRLRVQSTSTRLFLAMTTEKQDYDRLEINESYGLSIIHKDGRPEEARSAGAEHVVALALMGALQRNAPLRGPIVMDSPFGRLDESHTRNIIQALPEMASQVVLLVHEAEVSKSIARSLLRDALLREYSLERISSRRTQIREVS